MAVQYQAVASLQPLVEGRFSVGLGDIGLLIGLYFAPGIAVALPGGALAGRFGDRQTVAFGLFLMTLGGAVIAVSPDWGLNVAARVVAGIGGVVLNVVTTKMVTDWFAGREIGTAMALFINSWPFGIALALVILPLLAGSAGYGFAMAGIAGFSAVSFALVAMFYRAPEGAVQVAGWGKWPRGRGLVLTLLAGSVWGGLNVAIAAIFGFGAAVLVGLGWTLPTATAQISVLLWVLAVAAPCGSYLLDRTGRLGLLINAGLALLAGALWALWLTPEAWWPLVLAGIATGLAAGPIMTLPASVLPGEVRALGMGLFFTVYYAAMLVGPAIIGWVAERGGTALLAYPAGLAFVAATAAALAAFLALKRVQQKAL